MPDIHTHPAFILRATLALFVACAFGMPPEQSLAHQPRMTEATNTVVEDPEISKAYYAELQGIPQTYTITATGSFHLYVNILVPYRPDQPKDITVRIAKDGAPLATLDGANAEWKKFFEPFGYDTYWMGPEYKERVGAGTYQITVTSPKNDEQYSLAIGEIEKFDMATGLDALRLIPQIKREFFYESPVSFIFSMFGWGLIVAMYLLAFVVGFLYRLILKYAAKNTPRGAGRNINATGRWIRFAIAVVLLVVAITTTWSPVLLFFSGFSLFEAIFSWCGLHAALGRNTCARL